MTKYGLFQVIYNYYTTKTGNQRTQKNFIFIEDFTTHDTSDFVNNTRILYNRYKNYNNLIILDFDTKYNGYVFNKSKNMTLLLTSEKGTIQKGEKIKPCLI